jgi:hypothetical protein
MVLSHSTIFGGKSDRSAPYHISGCLVAGKAEDTLDVLDTSETAEGVDLQKTHRITKKREKGLPVNFVIFIAAPNFYSKISFNFYFVNAFSINF